MDRTLWYLVAGTRGGENRGRILWKLVENPMNTNQLAEELDLNYRTVSHHLEVLEDNSLIEKHGEGYGCLYFLTENMESNVDELEKILMKSDYEFFETSETEAGSEATTTST